MKNLPLGHSVPASVRFAKAIADETRQRIMQLCTCQWLSVTELVEQLNLAQPTVSHHLAIPREAGLMEVRHDGKQVLYKLNRAQMAQCCGRFLQVFAPAEATAADKTADHQNELLECTDPTPRIAEGDDV